MPRKIADSVVVITGASTGIGRAAALKFAPQGAPVVVSGRREQVLQRLAEHCERLGGRALAIPADVTDQEAIKSLARRVIDTFGRIDVWVNNAAVTLFARIEEAPYEAYRKVIETNLFGYIHGARAVLPYFRKQGSGTLINVSSVVGKVGSPFVSAYTTSKFGIVGLSESLRMELQDAPDIHVCTVLPASIDTPLFQHAANFRCSSANTLI
jgi:NAD(P)-dependent dehydrogenase (short-subunit alcohol dehydrogenase family)